MNMHFAIPGANLIEKLLLPYIQEHVVGDRQPSLEFRNFKSKFRQVKQGVPEGGVLSPTLFNLYVSSLPSKPADVKIITYADDITLFAIELMS